MASTLSGQLVSPAPVAVGREATTMCEAFQATVAARADRVALRTLRGEISITFADYAERVRGIAGGLHALGLRAGDTLACMLTNRPEFHLVDTAAMHLGATPFSVYNTSSAEQIAYVLADAGPRVFVIESAFRERALAAIQAAGCVEHLVVLDAARDGELTLEDLERADPGRAFDFEASWRSVRAEDLLTLIYTSGTTGPPKGVQITHANEIAECRGVDLANPAMAGSEATISYLPAAHIADRGLNHYGQMYWGDTLTTCPDPTQVFAYVADARPTRFGGVPRIWEKQAALEAGFAAEPDPARRQAIAEARALGERVVRADQAGETVPDSDRAALAAVDERIFGPLRAKLGFDRCRIYVIGAAPAPLELFIFFAAIGIPICEVWGMSETTSIATIVPADRPRFGTVGRPIAGVELRLEPDGELLVRGEIVMAGYRNRPEQSAEALTPDGWLRTGDVATIDADGFVRIVDRKKELIINAAGKNMSPANIEQHLKASSQLIGQAITIGDARPYNVALIVLDPDACGPFAAAHRLADASLVAMADEPAVVAEVSAGVQRANAHLSRVEQIKRFRILGVDWPAAGDELTPTMKLRRKPIAAKYAAEIEALYAAPAC